MDAHQAIDESANAVASPSASLALEVHGQQFLFRPRPNMSPKSEASAPGSAENTSEDSPIDGTSIDGTSIDEASKPQRDVESLDGLGASHEMHLGKAASNQLVFGAGAASRQHARVVYTNNDFFLIDHSTNGTFVQTEDERVAHVHRDKLRLWGSGWISLGEPLSVGPTIHFRMGGSS